MYDLIDSGLLGFLGESVLFGNIYIIYTIIAKKLRKGGKVRC